MIEKYPTKDCGHKDQKEPPKDRVRGYKDQKE